MSVDPLGASVGDPQSLNRYAYVLNSPLALIDPLGLQEDGGGAGCWRGFSVTEMIGRDAWGNPIYRQSFLGVTNVPCRMGGVPLGMEVLPEWLQKKLDKLPEPPPQPPAPQPTPAAANVPWAGGIFIPIPHTGGLLSVMVPFGYIPSSDTSCAGIGLAVTSPTGRFVSGGPVLLGPLGEAKSVMSGWGWNFGLQTRPTTGVQAIVNKSGALGGPTVATSAGASAGYGYSWCRP